MRKALKIIAITICSIIVLLITAILLLNTQWGQNIVRGRAEAFLRKKLKTELHIGYIGVGFPKFIVIKDVLFKDQAQDTLLAVQELKVDIAMLKLIKKKVDVQQLVLRGVHSHIYRNLPDTNYNFGYIITAFTGNKPKDTTTKVKDTTGGGLAIDLDRVKLDDIHIRVNDYTGGLQLGVNLDHLDLRMKKLDLDGMVFHIKEMEVAGLQTTFGQDTSYLPKKPKDTTETKLSLIADDLDLQNIDFRFNNSLNNFFFAMQLGKLQMQLNKFVLQDNAVDLKKLVVANSNITLLMGKHASAPAFVDTIIKKDEEEGWGVKAGNLDLANVSFKMDNENSPRLASGMDYAHMWFQNATMNVDNFRYTTDSISGHIKQLSVKEQCGLDVRALTADLDYNPQGATLDKLYLQTSETILQDHIELHYPSLDALKTQLGSMQFNLNLKKSIVGIHDVLLFVPDLAKQQLLRENRNGHVDLEAAVTGYLNNLNIKSFYARAFNNTEIMVNGRMSGLPDAGKLSYNLNIPRLFSSRQDIAMIVPDSVLKSVRVPEKFGIIGRVAGTTKDYDMDLAFASSDGAAQVRGMLHMSPGKGHEKYDLFVHTDLLDIGSILRQDSLLGPVSANFTVRGQSFDVKTMSALIDGDINSALVKGYRYHDIKLAAKVDRQVGSLNMMAADSNLRIQVTGEADFSGKYAAAKGDIKIDSIDLRALKLYKTELRASGTMHFDFPELNPDYPKGKFIWWQPVVTADGKRYFLDSLYIISRPSADTGQNIYAFLDVAEARITGKTPLTKIPGIIEHHLNRHYRFPVRDSIRKSMAGMSDAEKAALKAGMRRKRDTTIPRDYDLQVNAHVVDRPMLHGILPGLKSFDSIHLDASLTRKYIRLNVDLPGIEYNKMAIENAKINVNGVDSAFTYSVTANKLRYDKFLLWYGDVHGRLDKDLITTNISLSDQEKKERFAIAADMRMVGDTQIVQLKPGLKFNYKEWQVAQPNRIAILDGGFFIQNFEISNAGQFIRANSDKPQVNVPLRIDINAFELANLTEMISPADTLLAAGKLGGSVVVERMSPSAQMVGDISIKGLSIMRDTLGDLAVQVNNKQENAIDAKVRLTGYGNDISMNGLYYTQTTGGNDFKFDVDINPLSVHSFETLAASQIRNSRGYLRGKLQLNGTTSAPRVNGELRTDNLVTNVSQINSTFTMPSEKIEFKGDVISFNNFTIRDSANNKAEIDGDVNIADLSDMKLDLRVNANKWRALHSTAKDNKMFYGDLYLTTNMTVRGPVAAPNIDGTIRILKGTSMTIVNPESTPQMESRKGIVVFINMKDTGRRNVLVPKKKPTTVKRSRSAGSDLNVNVTVDKDAQFSLVIDQASGDFLSVRGDANINAAITPGGTISLTGTYALEGGAYQLNYNFIKRKFNIKQGSMITFAGDPVKGTMLDVTAVYEAVVPPYDLVQRQVPDQAQLNFYKQRIPFDVNLHLVGPVLTPRLTFDIELPENKVVRLGSDQVTLVQSKLSQIRTDTSELNKQVFAVLILNRFVSDDPFSSGATNSASTVALQSVSTFIGEQLNQAAGKFVKGVDISADLATTEDYTTGDMRQRTDLNLAASKRLLNDRLKLTIGNNFELEGPQTTNNQQSSYVPSNLAADYMLSADGRYTVRAYRRAYDQGVLLGFVTETGVNFIVSLDYNKFKNVFKKHKNEQDRQRDKEKKEEQKIQNQKIEDKKTAAATTDTVKNVK